MAKEADQTAVQALKNAIKAENPAKLYFFYGEETFLMHHYLQRLKQSIIDELTESFNFHRFTAETFDLADFADAVENLPMMAQRTMVQVDEVDLFKLTDDQRDAMAQVLSDIPGYCTVVFSYETTPYKPDKRYKKLYESVLSGHAVEFAKQNQRDLIVWVTRHFAAQGKQITPDLCAYLIELTDGTMTSLSTEIRKISAYSGADHICRADIDAVTEPVLDAVIYQMTDQLSLGHYGAALQKLQVLLKMQQDPVFLLAAIGNHLRRISAARTLLDQGKQAGELAKLYPPMADYAAKKAMDAARRLRPEFCKKAAELVMETDHRMKTSFDDSTRLLEMLILQLAQEAGNA